METPELEEGFADFEICQEFERAIHSVVDENTAAMATHGLAQDPVIPLISNSIPHTGHAPAAPTNDVPYIRSLEKAEAHDSEEFPRHFNFRSMLLLSGMVVAIGLVSATGFWLTKAGDGSAQIAADNTRRDWAGRPLATNANGDLVWPSEDGKPVRNIDLTQTGSINQVSEPDLPAAPQPIDDTSPAPAQQSAQSGVVYEVQPGDTLSAIGRRYGISAKQIMALNGIDDPRKLKPGMKLSIAQ